MLDGVFDASPEQLGMVMKQLQHLNRLTDEASSSSLADAGNLVLEDQPFCLDELIQERAAWIMPQADAHHFRITLRNPRASPFRGDAFRMGQVLPSLWKMRYVTDAMAAILRWRCTTPAGITSSNLPMTAGRVAPVSTGNV
jgi:hypothetical protein